MWPTTRATLVRRLRDQSDQDAWRLFVDLYAPLVFRYCRRRGWQSADAENITQEVFLHLSGAMRGFDYDPLRGRFRNWFGLLTHQRMASYRRRQSTKAPSLSAGESSHEPPGDVDGEWHDCFNSHVYRLAVSRVRIEFDNEVWQAFERVWDRQESPAMIGRDLGRDANWVYVAKHRVSCRLRAEVLHLSEDFPHHFRR
jgi:RNA polymerase sigma-70 factor (ECF subfamily)